MFMGTFDGLTGFGSDCGCGLLQLKDGDIVELNIERRTVSAPEVSEEEWAKRRQSWKAPPPKFSKGTLFKYIKNVSNASTGCVTDL